MFFSKVCPVPQLPVVASCTPAPSTPAAPAEIFQFVFFVLSGKLLTWLGHDSCCAGGVGEVPDDGQRLDRGVVLGLLRQLRLAVELVAGHVELDPVVAEHLLLVPHPHAVLKLEIVGLQKLEIHKHSLLGGPFIQFTGRCNPDLLCSCNRIMCNTLQT